jgi:DNA-binding NarL/FixJ family response regulator
MEPSPDQTPAPEVKCSVMNLVTGLLFDPCAGPRRWSLTARESEILSLIGRGMLYTAVTRALHRLTLTHTGPKFEPRPTG